MTSTDPLYHTAPLVHQVKQVLHKGVPLEERVRALRRKRRKSKQPSHIEVEPFDASLEANPPLTVEEVVAMTGEEPLTAPTSTVTPTPEEPCP